MINRVKLGEVHRLVSSKKDGVGGLMVACKSPIIGSQRTHLTEEFERLKEVNDENVVTVD